MAPTSTRPLHRVRKCVQPRCARALNHALFLAMNLVEATTILRRWLPLQAGRQVLGSAEWQRVIEQHLEALVEWLLRLRGLSVDAGGPQMSRESLPPGCRPHAAVAMACADLCDASPEIALQVALLSALLHAYLLVDDATTCSVSPMQSQPDFNPPNPSIQPPTVAREILSLMESSNPGHPSIHLALKRLNFDRRASALRASLQAWTWQSNTPLARFGLDAIVRRGSQIGVDCANLLLQCSHRSGDAGLGAALDVFAGRLGSALLVQQLHELRRWRALTRTPMGTTWRAEDHAFTATCQKATMLHLGVALKSIGALPVDPARRAALAGMCARWRAEACATLHTSDGALTPLRPAVPPIRGTGDALAGWSGRGAARSSD